MIRTTIERLGERGEGIADVEGARVYVPYALPGETVDIEQQGERAMLVGIAAESRDRVQPVCSWFETCGGCAVQTLANAPYAAWKRGLLIDALANSGVSATVEPFVDAHGNGRRRATFHSRVEPDGSSTVGFMRARAHEIVSIDACPILDPRLGGALPAARAIAAALAAGGKPLDIIACATDTGLDIELRGHGRLNERERATLVGVATDHRLARLSNHGVIVVAPQEPSIRVGLARVTLPPGTFLQATVAGETAMAERVVAACLGASRVADLFSGVGTFALRLAETAGVTAIDSEESALSALDRAARAAPELRPVRTETRDLFRRPLTPEELSRFDAVVLDPPRAGAESQMQTIAASDLTRVISVSCNVRSFVRDAAILTAAGFKAEKVDPIDQFRYSPHLEIVASFHRPTKKRKRRLLG